MIDRPALGAALACDTRCVALVGPRGCGKSVALERWAGERDDVTWHGQDPPTPGATHLVVDNFDELTAEEIEALDLQLHRTPHLKLRVAAHSTHRFPTEWYLHQVDVADLSVKETSEVLVSGGSSADARLVHAVTGGHAASVAIVARSAATDETEMNALLAQAGDTWSLDGAGPSVGSLATPHSLTPELVARLGGGEDFLRVAECNGWGRWSGSADAPVFKLAALARASLRAAARPSTGSQATADTDAPADGAVAADIHAIAAKVLLAHGAAHAAFVEATEADRLDLADAAVKAGGMDLLTEHGYDVYRLLKDVAPQRLRAFPLLAFALALTYNSRQEHRVRAAALFSVAIAGARRGSAQPEDHAVLKVLISVAMRISGVRDGGVGAALDAAETLAKLSSEQQRSIRGLAPDMHLHCGISLLTGERFPEAAEQLALAKSTSTRTNTLLAALGGLALGDALRGDLAEAEFWLGESRARRWPAEALNDYPGAMVHLARAICAIEARDFEAAERALGDVWPIRGTVEYWPMLLMVRSYIDLGCANPTVGLEHLRSLRERRERGFPLHTSSRRRLDALESLLCLAAGDVATARTLTRRPGSHAVSLLAAARVQLCTAADDEALGSLTKLPALSSPWLRATRAALLAVTLQRLDRMADAERSAAEAVGIMRAFGLSSPLMTVPEDGRDLFGKLADQVTTMLPNLAGPEPLTERETVVLAALVSGATIDAIADELFVSTHTVKSQRRSIYRKLGVRTREEAAATAAAHRLLDGVPNT